MGDLVCRRRDRGCSAVSWRSESKILKMSLLPCELFDVRRDVCEWSGEESVGCEKQARWRLLIVDHDVT